MNRCPDARDLLPAYVEGELGNAEARRVSGHLEICSACRQEEVAYRRALGAIASAPRRESPGDLFYGFQAKLDAANRGAGRQLRQLRTAAGAAVLVLVVGVSTAAVINLRNSGPADNHAGSVAPPITVRAGQADDHQKVAQAEVQTSANQTANGASNSSASPKAQTAPVLPHNTQDNTTERPRPRTKKQPKTEPIPESFLDVKPKKGLSINEQRRRMELQRLANQNHGYPMPTVNVQDGNSGRAAKPLAIAEAMTPERNERVQVGDKITTIKTAYKEDSEGRRTAIEVNIGTTSVQAP